MYFQSFLSPWQQIAVPIETRIKVLATELLPLRQGRFRNEQLNDVIVIEVVLESQWITYVISCSDIRQDVSLL